MYLLSRSVVAVAVVVELVEPAVDVVGAVELDEELAVDLPSTTIHDLTTGAPAVFWTGSEQLIESPVRPYVALF
jgi:hypothetical protein